ncbi:alpha/beta fold hydrolase [Chelativorans sp. YIM 93263]|uniref:alpha/beta fold hydrolase n=1 Tax=Chelativorans sp. YIM 93263 TaxID=2906648 RepID=UPI002379DBD1|nr:alpha/beta hydrolase [Chelativorans sp. YIM 93263]
MAFDIATTLKTPTEAKLRLYVCKARGKPRGVVQINHGLAEHAGRYALFASYLAERGFHVYAHDHRGHGHTEAPDAPLGAFGAGPAVEKVVEDVAAVHRRIRKMDGDLPMIVFGHSMGAMVGLVSVMRQADGIAGAALWNMPYANGLLARAAQLVLAWERFRLGSDVPSRLLPRLTFEPWARAVPDARTPFDWLSTDPKAIEDYLNDPLCGWSPAIGMWRDIFEFNLMITSRDAMDAVPRPLPIQLVGGGDDPSTDFGKAVYRLEKTLRAGGFSNLQTTIYPNFRHESLNEKDSRTAMRDFTHWAKRMVG